MSPTYNPEERADDFVDDYPQGYEPPKARSVAEAVRDAAVKRDAERFSRALSVLGPGADSPPLKHEPEYNEAVKLTTDIRKLRDDLNRMLLRFYEWKDVRDLGVAAQIELVQALALKYSSKVLEHWK